MSIKIERVTCPKCEGTGFYVDYFDPPLQCFERRRYKIKIKTTSDGRVFDETSKCDKCNGNKYINIAAIKV